MATLKAMFKLFDGYSSTIDKVNKKTDEATNKILKASGATDKLNNELAATGAGASSASSGLGKFLSIAALVAGAVKGMDIADEYMNTAARLDLINDGLQTQAELQDKIFAAADRAKGSYSDMASAISKMGLLAGESFATNDELIHFTELLQKSFKVSGASTTEQSSAMLQLSQAMAAGKLQGDEFRSIMENAPMLADAIAKFTGKSKGDLKEMSADGEITADIIKNALFMVGDDINDKFAEMPMTFADVWNKIKNGALQAFDPVIEKVNELINSEAFMNAVNAIIIGFNLLSLIIGGAIDFVVGNWPIIQALLLATAIYLAATLGPAFISAGLAGLSSGLMAAAGWIMANLPMLAVIATIAMIIYSLTQAGVTFEDIFGFIGGVVGVTVATIWNLFVGLFELLLGVLNFMVNPFVDFANFIGNVFTNPVSSVVYLFQGMADRVLGLIESIANAIDAVFGSSLGDAVSGWRTDLKKMADDYVAKRAPAENYQKLIDNQNWTAESFGIERMSYGEAWNKGQSVGKDVYSNISDALKGLTDQFTNKDDKGTAYDPTVVKGLGSNGKVKVDMSNEDLKYLRDIAERDYINKFSTATLAPNVHISFGDVHETADINKLKGSLEQMMREEIAVAAEGVF